MHHLGHLPPEGEASIPNTPRQFYAVVEDCHQSFEGGAVFARALFSQSADRLYVAGPERVLGIVLQELYERRSACQVLVSQRP